MKAIMQSRQLLDNSRALGSFPESIDPEALTLAPERSQGPSAALLLIVSKHDFGDEMVQTDGKHFLGCAFRNCTLLYSGFPVVFESCHFHNCRFEFSGAAGRTVQFLDCFDLVGERATNQSFCNPPESAPRFVN